VSVHRDVARGMRNLAHRSVDHKVSDLDYAVVTGVHPLAARHEGGFDLDEDDLVLGYSVRKWDADHSLAVGDTLVVKRKRTSDGDDWIALDVITDREVV
jgi:hypothetical protein